MILNDRYEYSPQEDRLGKGGFGTVYKAFDLQEQEVVALKFVQKSKLPERYSLYNEILRIRDLDHPNLVKYYDAFIKEYENVAGEEDEMHVGVMEYVNGGDLGAFMKMLSAKNPRRIRMILRGILKGLQYLHQHKIIHRDIKPQNILLHIENGKITPKIADFSISKQVSSELTSVSAMVGTYEYMSPEQLGKSDVKLGLSTDIWSFGVLAYQLLLGELPFGSRRKGDTDGQIIANILNPNMVIDASGFESPYNEVIAGCLQKDPEDRFQSIEEILRYFPEEIVQDSDLDKWMPNPEELKKEAKSENTIFFEDPELYTKTGISNEYSDTSKENPDDSLKVTLAEQESKASNSDSLQDHSSSPIANQLTRTLPPYPLDESEQQVPVLEEESSENSASRWAMLSVLLMLVLFGGYLLVDWVTGKQLTPRSSVRAQSQDSLYTQDENQEPAMDSQENSTPSLASKPTATQPDTYDKPVDPTLNNEDPWKIEVEIKEKNKPQTRTKEENENTTAGSSPPNNPTEKEKKSTIQYTASRKYDYVEEYPNGSIVSLDGKYGYLDTYGNIQIPLKYDDFVNFQEGLAAVKMGSQWGYINSRNQLIIPFRYERPGVFNGGIALVTYQGKDIYIDKKGKCVRDCE